MKNPVVTLGEREMHASADISTVEAEHMQIQHILYAKTFLSYIAGSFCPLRHEVEFLDSTMDYTKDVSRRNGLCSCGVSFFSPFVFSVVKKK